ncbi:MAG: pH regulation protein F [Clostridia bacterium]|nr:pH regulation protein F [Clostridia bacterium]
MNDFNIIRTAAYIAFGFLLLALVFVFYRLAKGPSLPDRLVALDLTAYIAIGMILTLVFISGQTRYIDVALIIALIVFIGSVAVAKFLKRRFYDR